MPLQTAVSGRAMKAKGSKQPLHGFTCDICGHGEPARNEQSSPGNVSPELDASPPIALDKFMAESGLSPVTIWRYRRAGWLRTLNINGRHYLTRAEILRFNARAAKGEFAKNLKPT